MNKLLYKGENIDADENPENLLKYENVVIKYEYEDESYSKDTVTLNRNSDLKNNFHICFTSFYEMSEIDIINTIKEVQFTIGGGHPVFYFTKESIFISLLLKNKKIHSLPIYNNKGTVIYNNTIPLSLTMIPIVCLAYCNIELNLKKEKSVVPYKKLDNVELIDKFKILPRELVVEIYKLVLQFQNIYIKPVKMKIMNNSIFLDSEDRRRLTQNNHQYLIEQYQVNKYKKNSKFKCNFGNNIKYIAIIVSKTENEIDINHKIDPIIRIKTYIYSCLTSDNDCLFLRKTNPEFLGLNHMPIGVYLISYSLKPGELKQTGSLNFNKIENFEIEIEFPPLCPNYYITVVGCNYNNLIIRNGMASVAYSVKFL